MIYLFSFWKSFHTYPYPSYFSYVFPSELDSFMVHLKKCLRYAHRSETLASYWLNLIIFLNLFLHSAYHNTMDQQVACCGPTAFHANQSYSTHLHASYKQLRQVVPSFREFYCLLEWPGQTVTCLKSCWKASKGLAT